MPKSRSFSKRSSSKDHPEQLLDASACAFPVVAASSASNDHTASRSRSPPPSHSLPEPICRPKMAPGHLRFSKRNSPILSHRHKDGQTVLLSLEPTDARSAGITKITITPQQLSPASPAKPPSKSPAIPAMRAVTLSISSADGKAISQTARRHGQPRPHRPGDRTTFRSIYPPSGSDLIQQPKLAADDAMPWDNQRTRVGANPAAAKRHHSLPGNPPPPPASSSWHSIPAKAASPIGHCR